MSEVTLSQIEEEPLLPAYEDALLHTEAITPGISETTPRILEEGTGAKQCPPGCECECHPPSPWPRFWRVIRPFVVLAWSAGYLYFWYKISGGLIIWLVKYYPSSASRIGRSPIGILAQLMLGLMQGAIVFSFALLHLWGLPVSLGLFGLLSKAVPSQNSATEQESDEVTYLETHAEEFGLPVYDETHTHEVTNPNPSCVDHTSSSNTRCNCHNRTKPRFMFLHNMKPVFAIIFAGIYLYLWFKIWAEIVYWFGNYLPKSLSSFGTDFYGITILCIILMLDPFVLFLSWIAHFYGVLLSMNALGLLPPTLERAMSTSQPTGDNTGTTTETAAASSPAPEPFIETS